jgi:hypothetical protein
VGLSGVSGGTVVPWATYEGGYFAKYGLRVDELQLFQATTVATQALLAGDVDFVGIGGDAPVSANLAAVLLQRTGHSVPGRGPLRWVAGRNIRSRLNRADELRPRHRQAQRARDCLGQRREAVPQVLDEGVATGQDVRRYRLLEATHPAQPLLEVAVVALQAVVQLIRRAMLGGRQQRPQRRRGARGLISDDPVGCINPGRSTVASGGNRLVLVNESSQPIATEHLLDTTGWWGGLPAGQRWT